MSSDAAHVELVRDLASRFDLGYWREKGEYPWKFVRAFAKAGWLGAMIPEEYGDRRSSRLVARPVAL